MTIPFNTNMHDAPHDRRIAVWKRRSVEYPREDYGWFIAEWTKNADGSDRVDSRGIPWGWCIGINDVESCSFVTSEQFSGWCDITLFLPDVE